MKTSICISTITKSNNMLTGAIYNFFQIIMRLLTFVTNYNTFPTNIILNNVSIIFLTKFDEYVTKNFHFGECVI